MLSGRLEQGREFLEEVVRSATTMSSMGVGRAMQLAWLGEALLLEGRVYDAERRAHEALSLAQRHASPRCPLSFPSRQAAAEGAQLEQARQHLTAAATMYREMGMRVWLDQVGAELQTSA